MICVTLCTCALAVLHEHWMCLEMQRNTHITGILNIVSTSNIGFPGVWVFRLDEDDVIFPPCDDNLFGKNYFEIHVNQML